MTVVGVVVLSFAAVLLLFVHLSRRSDLAEDVLAAPASGDAALAPLHARSTILPLSRSPVRHAGEVALRMSLHGTAASASSATIDILGAGRTPIATCLFARGSFRDTTVLRCSVHNLSLVRRVRIAFAPRLVGAAVVGDSVGVGQLLVPRSRSLIARLDTILARIGTKHPAPFSGWIVPIGTALWLSALMLVCIGTLRPRRAPSADEAGSSDER